MTIERLTALDRLMLGASATWPQDIGALAILDGETLLDETGRCRVDAVRASIAGRLHLVPRFRQVIHRPRRGLGGPLWVDAPSFDLAQHVREYPLEPPVDEAGLLIAIERLRRQPLDPVRPMWEMWLITGLPDRRVALFVKLHHTIADGMAAMITLTAFMDQVAHVPAAEPRPWRPAPRPSDGELIEENVARRVRAVRASVSTVARPGPLARDLRAAWPAIRELVAEKASTRTSLDRIVGEDRAISLIRSELAEVRAIGRAFDATVNDVLLAATAAGLRAVLVGRGEPIDDTIVRVYVPVSLRRRLRGPQQGNLIAEMAVPLELGEVDPIRRLHRIAAETGRRKAMPRTSLGTLMLGGRIGRRLLLLAVMAQRVNVTTASIPGPTRQLYFARAPILEVFPVLPLIANEPLGVGAISYAGRFGIGVTADRETYPDLDVFAAAAREELAVLSQAASSSTAPCERSATSAVV